MRWGQFPEVTQPKHRSYIRSYWRFLLGWHPPPHSYGIRAEVARRLRLQARAEVISYRLSPKPLPPNGRVISIK